MSRCSVSSVVTFPGEVRQRVDGKEAKKSRWWWTQDEKVARKREKGGMLEKTLNTGWRGPAWASRQLRGNIPVLMLMVGVSPSQFLQRPRGRERHSTSSELEYALHYSASSGPSSIKHSPSQLLFQLPLLWLFWCLLISRSLWEHFHGGLQSCHPVSAWLLSDTLF